MGALMAKHGFLGCQDILDGERGFWIMAGSDRCDFDTMVKGLGEEYSIVDVSFKPYSSCRFTHSTLDALSQVISEHGVEADDVREIAVKSFWDLTELFDDYAPKEIVDAQFSIPYTVSMIMLGIPTGPEWYKDELMRDQKVLNFARKVRIETDPEADRLYHESGDGAMPSTVELTTIDDRRFNAYVPYPSGHPKNPITVSQVKNKFKNLASHVLDDSKINEIMVAIDHLENLTDINDLTRLLF
jgi:2-methylcitrate dehydratase PrpD